MKKKLFLVILSVIAVALIACNDACVNCDSSDNECSYTYFACPANDYDSCQAVIVCDALFKVCDCETAGAFKAGAQIAIKWTSLSPGVYFINDYDSDPCDDGDPEVEGSCPVSWAFTPARTMGYWDKDQDDIPCCNEWNEIKWFDKPLYDPENPVEPDPSAESPEGKYAWNALLFTDIEGNKVSTWNTKPDWSYYCGYDCSDVEAEDKFVKAETIYQWEDGKYERRGYTVTASEEESVWWVVKIPYMMVDWDEATPDTYAEVKIELSNVNEDTGLCVDCKVVCECIITAFMICGNYSSLISASQQGFSIRDYRSRHAASRRSNRVN